MVSISVDSTVSLNKLVYLEQSGPSTYITRNFPATTTYFNINFDEILTGTISYDGSNHLFSIRYNDSTILYNIAVSSGTFYNTNNTSEILRSSTIFKVTGATDVTKVSFFWNLTYAPSWVFTGKTTIMFYTDIFSDGATVSFPNENPVTTTFKIDPNVNKSDFKDSYIDIYLNHANPYPLVFTDDNREVGLRYGDVEFTFTITNSYYPLGVTGKFRQYTENIYSGPTAFVIDNEDESTKPIRKINLSLFSAKFPYYPLKDVNRAFLEPYLTYGNNTITVKLKWLTRSWYYTVSSLKPNYASEYSESIAVNVNDTTKIPKFKVINNFTSYDDTYEYTQPIFKNTLFFVKDIYNFETNKAVIKLQMMETINWDNFSFRISWGFEKRTFSKEYARQYKFKFNSYVQQNEIVDNIKPSLRISDGISIFDLDISNYLLNSAVEFTRIDITVFNKTDSSDNQTQSIFIDHGGSNAMSLSNSDLETILQNTSYKNFLYAYDSFTQKYAHNYNLTDLWIDADKYKIKLSWYARTSLINMFSRYYNFSGEHSIHYVVQNDLGTNSYVVNSDLYISGDDYDYEFSVNSTGLTYGLNTIIVYIEWNQLEQTLQQRLTFEYNENDISMYKIFDFDKLPDLDDLLQNNIDIILINNKNPILSFNITHNDTESILYTYNTTPISSTDIVNNVYSIDNILKYGRYGSNTLSIHITDDVRTSGQTETIIFTIQSAKIPYYTLHSIPDLNSFTGDKITLDLYSTTVLNWNDISLQYYVYNNIGTEIKVSRVFHLGQVYSFEWNEIPDISISLPDYIVILHGFERTFIYDANYTIKIIAKDETNFIEAKPYMYMHEIVYNIHSNIKLNIEYFKFNESINSTNFLEKEIVLNLLEKRSLTFWSAIQFSVYVMRVDTNEFVSGINLVNKTFFEAQSDNKSYFDYERSLLIIKDFDKMNFSKGQHTISVDFTDNTIQHSITKKLQIEIPDISSNFSIPNDSETILKCPIQ